MFTPDSCYRKLPYNSQTAGLSNPVLSSLTRLQADSGCSACVHHRATDPSLCPIYPTPTLHLSCFLQWGFNSTSIPYLNTHVRTHTFLTLHFSLQYFHLLIWLLFLGDPQTHFPHPTPCLTNISSYLPHTEHAVNETLTFTFRYTPPFFPITNCPLQSLGRPIMPSSFLFQTSKLF